MEKGGYVYIMTNKNKTTLNTAFIMNIGIILIWQ